MLLLYRLYILYGCTLFLLKVVLLLLLNWLLLLLETLSPWSNSHIVFIVKLFDVCDWTHSRYDNIALRSFLLLLLLLLSIILNLNFTVKFREIFTMDTFIDFWMKHLILYYLLLMWHHIVFLFLILKLCRLLLLCIRHSLLNVRLLCNIVVIIFTGESFHNLHMTYWYL